MSMKKRVVIGLIRHPEYRKTAILQLMAEAWQAHGAACRTVYASELAAALNELDSSEIDEVVLYDDSLLGPVVPMDDMLSRAEAAKGWWVLASEAPMLGLPRGLWRRPEIQQALTDGGDPRSLSAVLGEGRELYDTTSMAALTAHPLLDEPLRMAEMGCPFFQHALFHRDYDDVIIANLGHQPMLFYNWLVRSRPDLLGPLWDFLLTNFHQIDIHRNLHQTYVLSTKSSLRENALRNVSEHKLLLVMHLYYTDKVDESSRFAARFPRETDVCITTNSEEKAKTIHKRFAPLGFNHLEIRIIENRGRDVSSLLVGAADLISSHEIVCFFHDKKVLQTKPGSIGLGFAEKLSENLFATADYVLNVVDLFAQNERLGLLCPPPPHHSDYYFTQGLDWGPNYQLTRDLADRLNLQVPIAPDKRPIAPLGTCFWFRSAAMKPLLAAGWKYEDFPPEPNNTDGTLLHAVERIYPFAVASAGYYPAYMLSDRWAKVEYSSLRYYVEGYNRVCSRHGIMNYQRNMRYELAARLGKH